VRGEIQYRPIPTFITAALLFLVGVVAVLVVTVQIRF
jgi:hypothetical protein